MDEKKWEETTEGEASASVDEILAYDDMPRKNGPFVGGDALQSACTATTLQ